jgi:integrase
MKGGADVKLELRYLSREIDRHGNVRFYVRKDGRRQRIHATPDSPDFLTAYSAAMASLGQGVRPPTTTVSAPDSLSALVKAYLASPHFKALSDATQRARRRILERICEQHGLKRYALMEPRHVRKMRDEAAVTGPHAGNSIVKALSALFEWAAEEELARSNPARGVRKLAGRSGGYHTWTLDEVRAYEDFHGFGTRARLALDLLLYTGVRRSDLVRLGRQHVEDGCIAFTPKKTQRHATRVIIPMLPPLAASIQATPSGTLTFLVTREGQPYTAAGFGNRFREWCDQAGLPHCSAHGVRKAGAAIAAERGATANQLMAAFGWKNIKEAEIYTRQAEQKRLARDAWRLLGSEQNADETVAPSCEVSSGATNSGKK